MELTQPQMSEEDVRLNDDLRPLLEIRPIPKEIPYKIVHEIQLLFLKNNFQVTHRSLYDLFSQNLFLINPVLSSVEYYHLHPLVLDVIDIALIADNAEVIQEIFEVRLLCGVTATQSPRQIIFFIYDAWLSHIQKKHLALEPGAVPKRAVVAFVRGLLENESSRETQHESHGRYSWKYVSQWAAFYNYRDTAECILRDNPTMCHAMIGAAIRASNQEMLSLALAYDPKDERKTLYAYALMLSTSWNRVGLVKSVLEAAKDSGKFGLDEIKMAVSLSKLLGYEDIANLIFLETGLDLSVITDGNKESHSRFKPKKVLELISEDCPRDVLQCLKSHQYSLFVRNLIKKRGTYWDRLQLTFDETGDTPITKANLLVCIKLRNFPMMRYVWENLVIKDSPVIKRVLGWIEKAIDCSNELAARWLLHRYHHTLQASDIESLVKKYDYMPSHYLLRELVRCFLIKEGNHVTFMLKVIRDALDTNAGAQYHYEMIKEICFGSSRLILNPFFTYHWFSSIMKRTWWCQAYRTMMLLLHKARTLLTVTELCSLVSGILDSAPFTVIPILQEEVIWNGLSKNNRGELLVRIVKNTDYYVVHVIRPIWDVIFSEEDLYTLPLTSLQLLHDLSSGNEILKARVQKAIDNVGPIATKGNCTDLLRKMTDFTVEN